MTIDSGLTILIGQNGAGKSTLIDALGGLGRLKDGDVQLEGASPYGGAGGRKRFMRRIGLVPQDVLLPDGARVDDAVRYAGWLKGMTRSAVDSKLESALGSLQVEDLRRRRIGTLSGGEKRRISIAVSLIHEPAVLILDEPTAGLDPIQRSALQQLLARLAAKHAVLVSTHLVEDIGPGVNRVVALGAGKISFDGTVEELRGKATATATGDSDLERGVWNVLSDPDGATW
ncbi:MAG: ATP-binding cassette domain-containing protein [Nocardioidaceae bacterium]